MATIRAMEGGLRAFAPTNCFYFQFVITLLILLGHSQGHSTKVEHILRPMIPRRY